MSEYVSHGFRIEVEHKPERIFAGVSRFVKLNGKDIFEFLDELNGDGRLSALEGAFGQLWVGLSGNEGRGDADCRCTVCVEAEADRVREVIPTASLYRLCAVESDWAIFHVAPEQSPKRLHEIGVYNMIAQIGYRFNWRVGFHLDNEHEWSRGQGMMFMLPVEKAE